MIGRRSFLAGILGAASAPAIVRAESLMQIIVPQQKLYTGELGVIDGVFRFKEMAGQDLYLQVVVRSREGEKDALRAHIVSANTGEWRVFAHHSDMLPELRGTKGRR